MYLGRERSARLSHEHYFQRDVRHRTFTHLLQRLRRSSCAFLVLNLCNLVFILCSYQRPGVYQLRGVCLCEVRVCFNSYQEAGASTPLTAGDRCRLEKIGGKQKRENWGKYFFSVPNCIVTHGIECVNFACNYSIFLFALLANYLWPLFSGPYLKVVSTIPPKFLKLM